MDSAHLWSTGLARRSLLGNERTHNPSPAASSLLGKRLVARAGRTLKARGRKRAHRGNPAPAVVALLGPLLGGRFQSRDKRDAGRKATADQLAERALLGDAAALMELERVSVSFATQVAKAYAATRLAQVQNALTMAAAEKAATAKAEAAAERAAAAAERRGVAAAGAAREGRFLQAGSDIGTAIGQAALSRGRGLPRRRPRSRSSRSRSRTRF